MLENKEILVSVIMPIYNAEIFLRETLDTVVNQTLSKIEIICVDDGSKDGTLAILQEYAKVDERIFIIEQQNQYAGVARNNGLSKATGKYVVFWDADDLFELDALEKMHKQIVADEADICVCGANQLHNESGQLIVREMYLMQSYLPENRPFAKEDMPENIFRFSTNVPWNKMFRREFLEENELQFQNIKQANDTYFVLIALFFAKRITYVSEKLMTYRQENDNSLTGKASDTSMCAYNSYEVTKEALMQQQDFASNSELQRGFANRAMQGFLHSLFSQKDITAYTKLYQFFASDGLAKFELVDKGEDYFINEKHYDNLQKMLKLTPEEFLLSNLKAEKKEVVLRKSRIAIKNQTIRRQKEIIKEQKQTIKEQKIVLESLAVRTALKTKKILTLNGRIQYKK